MSYTEFCKGKLKYLGQKTFDEAEEIAKEIFKRKNPELYKTYTDEFLPHYDNWMEAIQYALDGKEMLFYDEKTQDLWKIEDYSYRESEEFFFETTQTNDNEFEFVTQFYNGGTCFGEVLEDELTKLKKQILEKIST